MYKKIFAVLLAAALMLTLFAACGSKPDDKPGAEAPATQDGNKSNGEIVPSDEPSGEPSAEPSESESNSDNVTDGPDTTTETPVDTTAENPGGHQIETPTEPSTEKPTEPSTEKPTEPSTEKPTEPPTEPPKQLSADGIAAALAARTGLFSDSVQSSNARRALGEFGIESAWVADSAYYKAAGNFADQILVVKLASVTNAVNVKYCMEEQKEILAEDYADYDDNGTEVPKINNAVIYESGDVLVFCICANSSGARSALAGIVG